VEGLGGGGVRGELVEPLGLEIQRVDQHQAGHGVQSALLEQLGDPVVGLGGDPGIDDHPGGLGIGGEIEQVQAGSVVDRQRVQERGLEAVVLLPPQGVGRGQPEGQRIAAGAQAVDAAFQAVEARVHQGLVHGEVHHAGDLGLRGVARAGPGHGQGHVDGPG